VEDIEDCFGCGKLNVYNCLMFRF